MKALKDCPFCGGKALGPTDAWPHMVTCENCGANVKGFKFDDEGVLEAVEKWNKREPDVVWRHLQVHNVSNVDKPHGMSENDYYEIMNAVVEALEHTERGESWPYEAASSEDHGERGGVNDLISRAAALNALLMSKDYRDAQDMLEQLPAVDAASVRHGRWVKLAEAPEWDQRRCTVCGDVSCCQRNYCPNCGAKMDRGDDNER